MDKYIKAEFDRAYEDSRKYGPSRRAAQSVCEAANLIQHRVDRGQTGLIELDLHRLEKSVTELRRALRDISEHPHSHTEKETG